MSTAGVKRYTDMPGWSPHERVVRKITPEDIAYALARRPNTGWQALARQLGKNELDLREACQRSVDVGHAKERIAPRPEPEPEADGPPGPCVLRWRSQQAFALDAISRGATSRAALAEALGVTKINASATAQILRDKKMVGAEWELTPKGWQELENQGLVGDGD